MPITREQLIERIHLLDADIETAKAQLHAFDGARQEAFYWLTQMVDSQESPSLPDSTS